MKITELNSAGICLIETPQFVDGRGVFSELMKFDEIRKSIPAIGNLRFVQTNISKSRPYTVRGMHWQHRSWQAKLIHVVVGHIFQVAVDVRKGSKTFGQYFGQHISEWQSIFIPPGFANGFMALDTGAVILYQITDYYRSELERNLLWNDSDVGIQWPIDTGTLVNLSAKDRNAPHLAQIEPWERPSS